MKKKLIEGGFYGILELFTTILTYLIIPKFFISKMSMELYGLFLTLTLFSSYGIIMRLDFGIGGTVTTFTSKYHHTDKEKLQKLWTFSSVYFTFISILAVFIGLIVIKYYDSKIESKLFYLNISKSVLIPTLIMVWSSFISYLGDSFLFGFNNYKYLKGTIITQNIFKLLIIYVTINISANFLVIMWALSLLSLLRTSFVIFYLKKEYSEFIIFKKPLFIEIKEWLKYSFILAISSITGFIFNSINKILITLFLPVTSLAQFDIISKPFDFIKMILSSLISAIIPTSSYYKSINKNEKITELFFRSNLWINIILIPPLVFITIMMKHFIFNWIKITDNDIIFYAQIMVSSILFLNFTAAISNLIIIGIGEAQQILPIQISISIMTLLLSFYGIIHHGIKGIVWALFVGSISMSIGYIIIISKILNLKIGILYEKIFFPYFKLLIISFASSILIFNLKIDFKIFNLLIFFIIHIIINYIISFVLLNYKEKEFLLTLFKDLYKKINSYKKVY